MSLARNTRQGNKKPHTHTDPKISQGKIEGKIYTKLERKIRERVGIFKSHGKGGREVQRGEHLVNRVTWRKQRDGSNTRVW